ncbi:MAG TPA: hypothetical protein VH678_14315 [Xanthobacteraceae bacterium]|jgi:hypothetical protein
MGKNDDHLRAKKARRAELLELTEERQSGRLMPTPDSQQILKEWMDEVAALDREIAHLEETND